MWPTALLGTEVGESGGRGWREMVSSVRSQWELEGGSGVSNGNFSQSPSVLYGGGRGEKIFLIPLYK